MADDKTKVCILTDKFIVVGNVSLVTDARVTDFMDEDDRFFPMTNVLITTHDGEVIGNNTRFINLNSSKVVAIWEAD